MLVYILIHNINTENEGIHTVRIGDRHKVLMFADEDDATRYANLLEAQDFPTPSVDSIDSEEVEEFCRSANYDCELIEAGKLAIPPQKNVTETTWEAELTDETSNPEMSDTELDKIRRQLEGLL